MKRSSERRPIGGLSWTMATVVVVGLFYAAMRFTDATRLAGEWPLGIRANEVDTYAALFERFTTDTAKQQLETFYFGASGVSGSCLADDHGRGWDVRWMEAKGFGDSVRVRPLRAEVGGYVVKLRKGTYLREQRSFTLRKASVESIRDKYLEMLATELGVLTPELTLVRVVACGSDLGVFVKEEVIDDHFLQRRGMQDGLAFSQWCDPGVGYALVPVVKGDSAASAFLRRWWQDAAQGATKDELAKHVDRDALAAWSLLHGLGGPRTALVGEMPMAYRWGQGQVVPVYRAPRNDVALQGPLSTLRITPLTVLLEDEEVVKRARAAQDALIAERGQIRERMIEVARIWVPLLTEGRSSRLQQARAERIMNELLDARMSDRQLVARLVRPLEPGPQLRMLGDGPIMAAVPSAATTTSDHLQDLQRLTKLRVTPDSVIFPRGKYKLTRDLVLPSGRQVVVLPGARLELSPGVRVVCQGGLSVLGTRINPVFIRPARDGDPFVGLDVSGDGSTTTRITGLQMSGGGAGDRPMIHIQGMVNTVVQGCLLDGDAGSTVLQVVGGEVLVDGGVVTAGRLALTQTKATVKGVIMRGGTRKAGSAGMVLEGTRARLEGVSWSRCAEVALKVDQASQALVLKGRFEGNGTGISVLGGSQVHVEECRFTDQGTVYVVNSSGSTRGSSRLFLYTNEYQDNGKDRQVDERSMVQEGLRSSEALRSGATFIP